MLKIFNSPPKYNSVFYPTEKYHENTSVLEILNAQNILLRGPIFATPKTEIKGLHLQRMNGNKHYIKKSVCIQLFTIDIVLHTSHW